MSEAKKPTTIGEWKRQKLADLKEQYGPSVDKGGRVREHLYFPIVSLEGVNQCRNARATGNYPLGMSDCEVVGVNGDCGGGCPVLRAGGCPDQQEMESEL